MAKRERDWKRARALKGALRNFWGRALGRRVKRHVELKAGGRAS